MPKAHAEDTISFLVTCRPKSGVTLEELRKTLNVENVKRLTPDEKTRRQVLEGLKARGFKVYEKYPSPVVSASGTIGQFEEVFQTKLVKRRIAAKAGRPAQDVYEVEKGAKPPNAEVIPGAILVTIARKPQFCWTPSPLPPSTSGFHLRHPGDIALVTNSALVHRLKTPGGQRATGEGVVVAVLDDGLYPHPYYVRNGYDLRIEAAEDVTTPATEDPTGHGTRHTLSVFSCAPDATVYAIKMGESPTLPFDHARSVSAKVISCSWGWNLVGLSYLSNDDLAMRVLLLDVIADGITLVFSGGNISFFSFPAMMPEVIAVGGASVDRFEDPSAWSDGTSFTSAIFRGRNVPDLCGLASRMRLPNSDLASSGPASWVVDEGGTSNAAPQVAGVIALLLQKNPSLTPDQVKQALMLSAKDITSGTTSTGDTAGPGVDLATGNGLVNALGAWNTV
jgi:subtilisin family serine protease